MANIIASVEDGKLNYDYTDNSKKNGITPTGSTLGYDQFLQLLCAEMQYQDPLEPTSNTDYVAQMATFSQLEATLSLTETQESANASNLVGKQVILKVTRETTGQTSYVDGRVDCVVGTHTHVQTNDDRVLPNKTLYISDLGMTGPLNGILGVKKEIIIDRLVNDGKEVFKLDESNICQLNGVLLTLGDKPSIKLIHLEK